MNALVRDTTEQSARARADRRYGQGRVVSVDRTGHTCMIDVNFIDPQGNSVYYGPVPFQPQSPPSVGDNVTLAYTSADPHSLYIAGGKLSGGNQQSTITSVGGVTSIAATGNPPITGPAELGAGANCTLTQVGQKITIDVTAGAGVPATTVTSVGSANSVGSLTSFAREDHTHRGVSSVTGPTATSFGALIFNGPGVTQSGNTYTFSGGGGGSLAVQHNGTLVATEATIDFEDSPGITWTVTDDPTNGRVKVSATAAAAAAPLTLTHLTFTYLDFQAAVGSGAHTAAIVIPGLSANLGVVVAKLKHSASFVGTGTVVNAQITDAVGSLTGNLNVTATPSVFAVLPNQRGGFHGSGGAVLAIGIDCGSGLVSALTAGSLDVWLVTTPLV